MPDEKNKPGPNTPEGKAAVRLNPVRHGVLSQTPVIPLVEREEDWERLRSGVAEQLGAEGELEEELAGRVATLLWRMHRAVRFESETIARNMSDVPGDWWSWRKAMGLPVPGEVTQEVVEQMDRLLMARLLPGEGTLASLIRYESQLHRLLLQTLHAFFVLKGLRKPRSRAGEAVLEPPR